MSSLHARVLLVLNCLATSLDKFLCSWFLFIYLAGILVLLALGFLTPSFYYIPKASLAAVIISAVIFMIDFGSIIPMWTINSKFKCYPK